MVTQLIFHGGYGLVVRDDKLYFKRSEVGPFYCYDLKEVYEIRDIEYYAAKFGKVFQGCERYLNYDVIEFHGDLYLSSFREPYLIQIDCSGKEVMKWEFFAGEGITSVYDISFAEPGSIWLAAPLENCIVEVSLLTKRTVYKSPCEGGYDLPGYFSRPEAVEVYGDFVYVSDMGNERICKVNRNTYLIETYLQFTDAVFAYKNIKGIEIVLLGNEIYQISKKGSAKKGSPI